MSEVFSVECGTPCCRFASSEVWKQGTFWWEKSTKSKAAAWRAALHIKNGILKHPLILDRLYIHANPPAASAAARWE